jgi:hypothetical protein
MVRNQAWELWQSLDLDLERPQVREKGNSANEIPELGSTFLHLHGT